MDNLVGFQNPPIHPWQKSGPIPPGKPPSGITTCCLKLRKHVAQEQGSQEFGVASAACTIPGEDPPTGDGQK